MSDNPALGFLQHIVADPDDNTPRLIYADWLEEHGNSVRAEFIRVQIEGATLPEWDARQVRLRLREKALIDEHGQKWKAELPSVKGIEWGDFRRGFVATATFASFRMFRESARACWAAAPIEAVTVGWPSRADSAESIAPIAGLRELHIRGMLVDRRDVEYLADTPVLSTLRVLAIRNASMGAGPFERLTASPHLESLKALRVLGNSLGNSAVPALFDAVSLTSLEELDLSENDSYARYGEDPILDPEGLESLAGWPGMARLRSLNLSGNDVGQLGLRALLRSPHAVGLKTLVLRGNGLPSNTMQEFSNARPELRLEGLDLGGNRLGDLGAADLAQAPCLADLKCLTVDSCDLPPTAGRSLARAPFLPSLRRLDARYNRLCSPGLQYILDAEPQELHTLLLNGNDLEDEAVLHLASSPASNTLRELDLARNGLGEPAAEALASSKYLQNLLILRLSFKRTGLRATEVMNRSPLVSRLAILDMSEDPEDEDIPF